MMHRADSGFQSGLREDYCRSTEERRDAPLLATLLAQGKIRFGIASDINRLRLVLGAFMPRDYGVAAVGNILDLVGSRLIGLSVVRSWRHNDVTRHLRMHVAQQGHSAGVIELEGELLSFWPCAEVMTEFLVPPDRSPEDVVGNAVAVQEIHRGALLHYHNVRLKHQTLLVHDGLLGGSRKGLARDGIDINHRLACNAGDFSADGAGVRGHSNCHYHYKYDRNVTLHDFSW